MESNDRATRALTEIVKRYPTGTASLFTGAGIPARPTGRNLAHALRKGHVTPRQLYAKTLGANFDNFNISNNLNAAALAGAKLPGNTPAPQATAGAGKFENIINGLLNTANQAADIYGKFKSTGPQGAGIEATQPVNQPAGKPMPWGLIAAGAGLVIVLVVVLVMLKKK